VLVPLAVTDLDRLALALAQLASDAGRVVMDVYETDFEVRTKSDASPVSEADERAEALLVPGVAALLPGVPIIAEEAVGREGVPAVPSEFVLIDPVDGTREFVSRNGDFTVNIALVRDGVPVAGVVYAPAKHRLFVGATTAGTAALNAGEDVPELAPLRTRAYPAAGLVAVASRSHLDERTAAFLDRLQPADRRSAGSSLTVCLVAAAEADVYPRFGPTMEWDTAAGDAVLRAAGGTVVDEAGQLFRYGKAEVGLRNGPFIGWGGVPLLTA
jgi:3'(2'), 5'-bisphosphate nucleotidase